MSLSHGNALGSGYEVPWRNNKREAIVPEVAQTLLRFQYGSSPIVWQPPWTSVVVFCSINVDVGAVGRNKVKMMLVLIFRAVDLDTNAIGAADSTASKTI